MDHKKAGIRLRHLEQQEGDERVRDYSPSNPNRKKIFDKNNRCKPKDEKDWRKDDCEEDANS